MLEDYKFIFEVARLIISILTLIAVPVSVAIAYRNLQQNQTKNRTDLLHREEKEILEQCILSLNRAFEVLGPDPSTGLAYRSRLRWLACARMLLRYSELKSKLGSSLYITVCDEHEEFWRHKFYDLLNSEEYTAEYFSPKLDIESIDNIDCRSGMVIFGFTKWRQDAKDPLQEFDVEKALKVDGIYLGRNGFEHYLELYPRYQKMLNE